MNIKSEISKGYRILHLAGAAAWLLCSLVSAGVVVMIVIMPDKNAWNYFLIAALSCVAVVLAFNALSLAAQVFKSLEVKDNGQTIVLKQFGKTITLRPEEITQVKLAEEYLLYSFSTKPRKMLVIEAANVKWEIRSDIITSYDKVINFFLESDEK
ncbi:MAG TPA: hypothetical protein DHV42_04950 [Lachnospiraceae bacterium]|nr:hypothetical protein [Lachnospiraceae bacterium]